MPYVTAQMPYVTVSAENSGGIEIGCEDHARKKPSY